MGFYMVILSKYLAELSQSLRKPRRCEFRRFANKPVPGGPKASEASEEADRSSRNSLPSRPSSRRSSGAAKSMALSRRGALAEAPKVPEDVADAMRSDSAASTPMPSRPTSSIAERREMAVAGAASTATTAVRRVSQRPQSQMRLRVQANRPFSAPRMRFERALPSQRKEGDTMPVVPVTGKSKPARRPSSANVGKTPRADGRRGRELTRIFF
eukprot:s562_g25.t1